MTNTETRYDAPIEVVNEIRDFIIFSPAVSKYVHDRTEQLLIGTPVTDGTYGDEYQELCSLVLKDLLEQVGNTY